MGIAGRGAAALAIFVSFSVVVSLAGMGRADPAPLNPAALLSRAEALATALPPGRAASEAWGVLAQSYADLNATEAGLAAAQMIGDDFMRAEALAGIAIALARLGDSAAGLRLANSIEDAREQSARLAAIEGIGVTLALQGQPEAGWRVLDGIEDIYRRAEAQSALARAVAGQGDFTLAMDLAARIESARWLPLAAASDAYRFSEASVEDMWFYHALAGIAGLRAEAAPREVAAVAEAAGIARMIRAPAWQARAMQAIALAQARAGDVNGAIDSASAIGAISGDLAVFVEIARIDAMNGKVAEARATASAIAEAYGDPAGRVAVVTALAKAGAFAEAEAEAALIRDNAAHQAALAGIALGHALAGDHAGALTTAAAIPEDRRREELLTRIAVAEARAGRADDAQATLSAITSHNGRALAQASVAVALAEGGAPEAALALAEAAPDATARITALAGIARLAARN